MSFEPQFWHDCQAAKIAPIVVPYTQGKCLDIGSGPGKVWPRCIGIDTGEHGGRPITDMHMDGTDLSMFGDNSVDGIFSSFMLHHFERSKVVNALKEWSRVVKVGGFITIYVPNCLVAPKAGEENCDPRQKWNIRKGDINSIFDLDIKNYGFDLIEEQDRQAGDEFGLLTVMRKRADLEWSDRNIWQRTPCGQLRALVIRMGAIGDAIVAASILKHLKAQDYYVTVNCNPRTEEVLRHDPNIDEFFVQETDFVPNELLGPYWNALSERYDRIINLSESVEGLLLTLPGRLNHSYSDEARRSIYGHVNYLEHTHNIAAVPHDFSGSKFYATEDEKKWAAAVRKRMDGPVVVWTINGSSVHKVWPWVHIVCKWLLEKTPAHIVLYADPTVGKELAKGILECLREDNVDVSRIKSVADKWTIRQSLTFAQLADVVVGPETGPTNAVAMEPMPKVVYLSHSSPDNLTKHWINATVLEPDTKKAPCWPCHRLHFNWDHCFKDDATGAALCAASIKPERMFKAIAKALGAKSK